MDGWISIHPFWDRWLEIQPTPGGISIQWMDFHPVVGIPSILDGFPTAWMEIQPLGLVGLDVVVSSWSPAHRNLTMSFGYTLKNDLALNLCPVVGAFKF